MYFIQVDRWRGRHDCIRYDEPRTNTDLFPHHAITLMIHIIFYTNISIQSSQSGKI